MLGRFRLCPREDEIEVKIIDIMRPFRLPTAQHGPGESKVQHGLGDPERSARTDDELKGMGAQFGTTGAMVTTVS